ncbi:hypothetical protein EVAR_69328_1 [Eumeta japonica]|uniref:Uncharacterized protein n=1 Tax=Eumeta variegata TaxID=151549 RepID=A0A4C2A268_EUMVA|nr:hypothetical protein EVAR_69328_1 [Eumeta japonica]
MSLWAKEPGFTAMDPAFIRSFAATNSKFRSNPGLCRIPFNYDDASVRALVTNGLDRRSSLWIAFFACRRLNHAGSAGVRASGSEGFNSEELASRPSLKVSLKLRPEVLEQLRKRREAKEAKDAKGNKGGDGGVGEGNEEVMDILFEMVCTPYRCVVPRNHRVRANVNCAILNYMFQFFQIL